MAVRFGQPIRLQPSTGDRAHLRDVTDELMADIADLCGQRYDDHYAKVPATSAARSPRRHGSSRGPPTPLSP